MSNRYTDAENTGAPLVPMVEQPDGISTDGGRVDDYEEVVLSHRLTE